MCVPGGHATKALNVPSVCGYRRGAERQWLVVVEVVVVVGSRTEHAADQPRVIAVGGCVCVCLSVCSVLRDDECRMLSLPFNSLLYMLERIHTMQNAGSTVADIAIVHVVCQCVCVEL